MIKSFFLTFLFSSFTGFLWADEIKSEVASNPESPVAEEQKPEKAKNFTGSVVQLENKETYFQITLPENPSTGFRCYLSDYDEIFLEPISSSYVAPEKKENIAAGGEKSSKHLVGASGTRTFVFQVKPLFKNAPQMTKLEFQYHRPWSADDKGKKKTIIIYSF